jgi:hypothetical protein
MLTVTHNEKGYANIAALVKLPKGMKCPKAVNATKYLSLEGPDFDPKAFSALSDRLKETITKTPEYKRLFENSRAGEDENLPLSSDADGEGSDDIPF